MNCAKPSVQALCEAKLVCVSNKLMHARTHARTQADRQALVNYACRHDKEREHAAALEVLPDLLHELDQTPPKLRLTSLIEGILAGNIFDWGAKATVDLYRNGTILEIYR